MHKFFDKAKSEARNFMKQQPHPTDTRNTQSHQAPLGGSSDTSNDHQQIRFSSHPEFDTSNTNHTPNIRIKNVEDLGLIQSVTTHVKRDLGFQGRLGAYSLLSYGDTLNTNPNNASDETFRGMVSDTIALATRDPLRVVDPNLDQNGNPRQGLDVRADWGEEMTTHSLGITNVVETSPGHGIIYYLLNHRPGGINNEKGAGIATITLDESVYPPIPRTQRISQYIWDGDKEPWWGDCSAFRHPNDGHIYLYANKKNNPWTYLARVKTEDVLKVECYEYWHGKDDGWRRERLMFEGDKEGEKYSIFWQAGQGQVFWSDHFKCFLFIYCDNFWSSTVLLRSAPKPEGPWSDSIDVKKIPPVTEGGTIYAAVPRPEFDPSGKTLVVAFTNHPNVQQAIRVEFE